MRYIHIEKLRVGHTYLMVSELNEKGYEYCSTEIITLINIDCKYSITKGKLIVIKDNKDRVTLLSTLTYGKYYGFRLVV